MGAVIAVIALVLLGGCSSHADNAHGDAPKPLTASQAALLAVVQFNAHRAGMLAVRGTVADKAQSVTINGWINTAKATGYALVDAPQAAHPGAFLTEWNAEQVRAQDTTATAAPLPPPTSGWQSATLNPKASTLAAAQVLLVSLAANRPDNPQLLVQSNARFLGTGTVNGTAVSIMSGPVLKGQGGGKSSFRYWVGADGNLLRLQATLDGVHESTFDFTAAKGITF